MSGTPSGYTDIDLGTHGWILAGTTTMNGWSAENNPLSDAAFTNATDGVLGIIDDLMAFGKNPYQTIETYDPTQGGVMSKAWDHALEAADAIQDNSAEVDWYAGVDVVRSGLEDLLSGLEEDISGAVSVYAVGSEADFLKEVARINNLFSDANTVNSSTRGMMTATIEREHLRGIDAYRERLSLAREQAKYQAYATGGVNAINQIMFAKKSDRVEHIQAAAQTLAAAQAFYQARRQSQNDELRLDLENLLWDIKLYDFANKGLSAISGAAVIPSSPNPGMEAISSTASIMGSLAPLFA